MPDLVEAILSEDQDRSETPSLILAGKQESVITYATLRSCIRRLKASFEAAGLGQGSVCCLALPNGPDFVAVFLAIMDLKAVVAPLNPALKESEISYAVTSLTANAIIGPKGFVDSDIDLARASAGRECILAECYWDEGDVSLNIVRQNSSTERPMAMLSNGDDFAVLALHTSGTTGKPKSVPLLQSNLQASADNVIKAYDLTATDRSVLVMPLFHIHGIVAGLLAPLLAGSCVIIPQEGYGPDFWTHFETHQATWWTATPTHHKILLSFPRPPAHVQPRFIRSCSSPLAPNLLRELETAFKAPVLEAYAMTENAHHIASHILGHEKRPGTVGLPCETISLKIVDDNEEEAKQGDVGEVVIKGPSVMHGYFDNPEANAKAFTADGHFRTGDQGMIDDLGHVRLTGRLKELINKGGEKISPNEVDQVVIEHEDISEAVAFAAPDELYGEEVAIAVVPRPGTDIKAADLKRWLQGRIADFKIPRHICVMETIPKTATGKVQRTALSGLAMPSDNRNGHTDNASLEQIWSQILGIDASNIRKDSNFFDLGGNSVQAIRLATEAKSKGLNLDAATVFRSPTLGEMNEQCKRQEQPSSAIAGANNTDLEEMRNDAAQACGVAPSLIEDIACATPLQRKLAALNRDLGLWALSVTFSCQNVKLADLEAIVETIRSRNPILRSRTVHIRDETYNAVVQDKAIWETSSDLAGYLSQTKGVHILYGASQIRFAYIHDENEGPHFVITSTHTVQDVWTRGLLYDELKMGLEDLAKLQDSPKPISFCEFARYATSVDAQEAEQYWSKLLNGFDQWSYLSRDGDPNTVGTNMLTKTVHPKTATQSHDLSDITRIHLAWCLTLSSLSSQDRISFQTVSSGRLADLPGIETMMGPTLTTFPVCIDLSAFKTITDVLSHLRSSLFGSVKYEASAPEHTTRHFGTGERETLLNCSEVPEQDGLTLAGREKELRLRKQENGGMYSRLSVLMNMRVMKREGGLRLEAAYEMSGLSRRTAEDVLGSFAELLREVGGAEPEVELVGLRDFARKSVGRSN